MRFALPFLILGVAPVAADGWARLPGEEIRTALADRVLDYGPSRQSFSASGRTLFTGPNGEDAGSWRVSQDQYCSAWPPSDLWTCYVVERDGDSVRFISAQGDITTGRYAD